MVSATVVMVSIMRPDSVMDSFAVRHTKRRLMKRYFRMHSSVLFEQQHQTRYLDKALSNLEHRTGGLRDAVRCQYQRCEV